MIETLFQLGDPVEHRGVVTVPLYPRRSPAAAYLTLEEAMRRGFAVRETSAEGSVPELLAENPLEADVLLYDGEELTGAKQNRILNVTVLVGPRSTLKIPVSCVEQGRWQRRSEAFAAAPQAAHPRLRRRKAESLHVQPLARGRAQADVWDEIALTAARLGVESETGANADAFGTHRSALASLEEAFPLQPGQCGAVLALGGELCLDAVSRPEAFAGLWPKLRAGYLLDALDRLDGPPAGAGAPGRFVAAVSAATVTRGPSAGRGEDVRLDGMSVLGSGLELDGELLQLSAFTRGPGAGRRTGRIARPSRRRAA